MKRFKTLIILLMVVLALAVWAWAGRTYTNSKTVEFTYLDSSASIETYTDSLTGARTAGGVQSTGAPNLYMDGLADITTLSGIIECYILKLDTDDAAAQIADTLGNDTVIATLYTAWQSPLGTTSSGGYIRAGETALWACTLSTMTGLTASKLQRKSFSVTSGVGNAAYWRFYCKYQQPDNTAADSVGIHYRVGVSVIGR